MPKIIQTRNFFFVKEEEWRILTAVETGMRNHEYVQVDMIQKYAGIQFSGKSFVNLLRSSLIPYRLIAYENNGCRLTNLGYDFLALHKFLKSGIVYDLSNFQFFATGKESDLYICNSGPICHEKFEIASNHPIVLKFHRLGRTSFRQVKNKREYKNGNNCSWLYLNRISSTREYQTMEALYEAGMPVPIPVGHNRGAVAMEYVNSVALVKFSKFVLENGAAELLYNQAKCLLIKFVQLGLIHGDFNEFNLLVEIGTLDEINDFFKNSEISEESDENSEESSESEDEEESEEDISGDEGDISEGELNECPYLNQDINTFKLRMIDFPQVISRNNKTAQEIYNRDRQGIISFFQKFVKISESNFPPERLEDIERVEFLDVKLKAPGFPKNLRLQTDGDDDDDEIGSEIPPQENPKSFIKVDDIKKRLAKEKTKRVRNNQINKQQRNSRKNDCRRDLKDDFFK